MVKAEGHVQAPGWPLTAGPRGLCSEGRQDSGAAGGWHSPSAPAASGEGVLGIGTARVKAAEAGQADSLAGRGLAVKAGRQAWHTASAQ